MKIIALNHKKAEIDRLIKTMGVKAEIYHIDA
jgi:hypothetical protein